MYWESKSTKRVPRIVVQFSEWLCKEVIKAVPHRRVVFSIPNIQRQCGASASFYMPTFRVTYLHEVTSSFLISRKFTEWQPILTHRLTKKNWIIIKSRRDPLYGCSLARIFPGMKGVKL